MEKMPSLILYDNTATVFEMLWDIALAYFVIRLGAIYASLTFTMCAATSFLLTWATVPQTNSLQTSMAAMLLLPVQLAVIVACALFMNTYHEIPKDWRLRAGVGGVGAALMAAAALALRPVTGMEAVLGGKGVLACVTAMPVILMVLERGARVDEREGVGLLHGREKMEN